MIKFKKLEIESNVFKSFQTIKKKKKPSKFKYLSMNTFEQNFSTFDKFKFSNEADEKPNSFTNFPEDKTKKGLSDLTNILKSQKPNIPLKNKKNDGDTRIHVEIANIHYEIINKIQSVSHNMSKN